MASVARRGMGATKLARRSIIARRAEKRQDHVPTLLYSLSGDTFPML